ncbi:hypothetical protein EXU48_16120 [Occultella glacieicola]|uniref:Pyrrolo-quinoline quinone repeat domain-containing protein n=1 Tax=Occultella glacieicola TaxID=2518684 RepID=A0ABY2E158_9MICO|nr:PQQ-binding-like beta-propeller repeat protein [Occultella glacieicola]TDE91658.1 hypothetical protein EXU48_16120 [Occultella glacieicola]
MRRGSASEEFTLTFEDEEPDGASGPAEREPGRSGASRRRGSLPLITPWLAGALALVIVGVLIAPPVPVPPGWGLVANLSEAPRLAWVRDVPMSAAGSEFRLLPERVAVVADQQILGIDRETGADRWTVSANGPRCTDDGARLLCVSGVGQSTEILLIDPRTGAVGVAGLPGVASAITDGDAIVTISLTPDEYLVSRYAGAATALAGRQGSGVAPAGRADPPADVPGWATQPTWTVGLEPGIGEWQPAIAVFGSEVFVSVARETDGPSGSAMVQGQGHVLDSTTGALVEDLSRAEPGWLGARWLVARDPDGVLVYSPDRDPIPLAPGQEYLQIDDDPRSAVAIRSLETTRPTGAFGPTELVATDAASGAQLWSRPDEWVMARVDGIVVATNGPGIVGVEEHTGAELWSLSPEAGFVPTFADGQVLAGFAGTGESLVGIDVRTGDLAWELRTNGNTIPLALDGDRYYTLSQSGGPTLSAWDVG